MIKIRIDQSRSKSALNIMRNGPALLNKAIEVAMMNIALYGQRRARELAPFKRGILRNSITWEHQFTPAVKRVRVGTDLPYAAIHEFGGVIRPKNKKVLAFKVGGRMVFARRVTIPKYKKRGYFAPTVNEINNSRGQEIVETELNKFLN